MDDGLFVFIFALGVAIGILVGAEIVWTIKGGYWARRAADEKLKLDLSRAEADFNFKCADSARIELRKALARTADLEANLKAIKELVP